MVQVQPPGDSGLSVIFLDVCPVYTLEDALEFSFQRLSYMPSRVCLFCLLCDHGSDSSFLFVVLLLLSPEPTVCFSSFISNYQDRNKVPLFGIHMHYKGNKIFKKTLVALYKFSMFQFIIITMLLYAELYNLNSRKSLFLLEQRKLVL